jgi:hypothetical protein
MNRTIFFDAMKFLHFQDQKIKTFFIILKVSILAAITFTSVYKKCTEQSQAKEESISRYGL